jgi:hypothetical protein
MLYPREFRLRVISILLALGCLAGALQGAVVRAALQISPQQDNPVISEFRTRGPNGGYDEFVEIFNPTVSTIDISNWKMWGSNNSGGIGGAPIYTFPVGTILQPGQHFLLGNSSVNGYSGAVPADDTYTIGITDNGGLALTLPDDTPVDQVGMSSGSLYKEGTTLTPLSGYLDQSYERGPGGESGNCTDTDNNAFDFRLIAPSNPQNQESVVTLACIVPPTATSTDPILSTNTATSVQTGTATSTPTASSSPSDTITLTNSTTLTATVTADITPTPTSSATNTPTPTPTSSSVPSPTLIITPSAPAYIVISEFRSRGPNGADDEYIELFNPSGAAVNIGAWMIKKSSSCGTSISTLITLPAGTILLSGQHYLAAATGSSLTDADKTYTASLADDGGLALVNALGTVVDQVGMCATTQYREGTALVPLAGSFDQSYERKPGGATSCYDTNNNSNDFSLISPASPLTKASPVTMCTGVVTYTPTSTPTRTQTATATRTATTIPGIVVINEFLPHPNTDWNGDGTANTGDEYIELINMGTEAVDITNWKLDNGSGTTSYTIPNISLIEREIVIFYHSETGISLSDGGSTVRLLKSDGRTADIYTYPGVTTADQSWCRLPDGRGAWGFDCLPTPGELNKPIESDGPSLEVTPEGMIKDEVIPICRIDSAPQPVLSAECNAPGGNLWHEAGSQEIWLESRWKVRVFVD